jgi:hypothetical protein
LTLVGDQSYLFKQMGTHFFTDILFVNCFQIVHWRNHLRFPEEARLTSEAKDLICRLLCDVEHRLGTGGAHQIKVRFFSCQNVARILLVLCSAL